MSWSDIVQFVGTGSVPVIVAGTVYGVFDLGEKLASQRAKDALSKWLVSFDVQKAKALPHGTQGIFERIFGKRHFSLKCFIRSVAFSFGAVTFLGVLLLLIDPRQTIANLSRASSTPYPLALWVPWMILLDYISLFKTRVILRILAWLKVRRSSNNHFIYRLYGLYSYIFGWNSRDDNDAIEVFYRRYLPVPVL